MPARRKTVSIFSLIVSLALLSLGVAMPSFSASASALCDAAQFVSDVTIPDGTRFNPGAAFVKTWRLKNVGTCTWTTAYSLTFVNGERMGGNDVSLPNSVAPGATVDLSVNLVAPASPGTFFGYWQLRNASGAQFGLGLNADKSFWVEIVVAAPMIEAFDFTAEVCGATWSYDGGPIPCPVKEAKKDFGYVIRLENPSLENGSLAGQPGLLTVPQNKYNGVIRGVYPVVDIFPGDRFQALIGCQAGAVSCYVTFELDYLTPANDLVTIWKFREKYDGLVYPVDLDIGKYSFKSKIKLVLIVTAAGPASGDFAIWVAPRIMRAWSGGPLVTPVPATVGPTAAAPTPTPATGTGCDLASFVTDVTIPDGTTLAPGASFTKTWRLKNVGTCTWTNAYSLVFVSGEKMGALDPVGLPQVVAPGQTVDLSVNLVAPILPGTYRGYWELKNAAGMLFGIGAAGDKPFWVQINVAGTPTAGTVFDFVGNVCAAQWSSSAGLLPCPGADGDARGFVYTLPSPKLENGITDTQPGLLTSPQNVFAGYIQGSYPAFAVQSGDRFQAKLGCEFGALDCFVVFRLDYQIGAGPVQTFWTVGERYEGLYYSADIDLSALAGQNVKFILTVLANGNSTGDRALWGAPRIVRTGSASTSLPTLPPPATATPVPPPTATPTSVPITSLTYTNLKYGFKFNYPLQGVVSNLTDNGAHITLPFVAGTNLVEKYLDVSIQENVSPCTSPLTAGAEPGSIPSQPVVINGITFSKESAEEAGVGNVYKWTAYSTLKGNACISMGFLLHWLQAGNFATPPPLFDEAAESAVFTQIMSTFAWLTP